MDGAHDSKNHSTISLYFRSALCIWGCRRYNEPTRLDIFNFKQVTVLFNTFDYDHFFFIFFWKSTMISLASSLLSLWSWFLTVPTCCYDTYWTSSDPAAGLILNLSKLLNVIVISYRVGVNHGFSNLFPQVEDPIISRTIGSAVNKYGIISLFTLKYTWVYCYSFTKTTVNK